MPTPARAALLGIAAVTLAACGNVHPGTAAVVDGRSISMKTFEDTARIYCTLTLKSAQQQGIATVSNAEVRRQAVSDLVTIVVARKLAKKEGVVPSPMSYGLTGTQRAQIAEAFPDDDAAVSTAIERSQEIYATSVALGEELTGQQRSAENEADLAQAGQAQILTAFSANGVRFDPRFGLSAKMKPLADTGSLSVAEVDLEKPTENELPTAQRCS